MCQPYSESLLTLDEGRERGQGQAPGSLNDSHRGHPQLGPLSAQGHGFRGGGRCQDRITLPPGGPPGPGGPLFRFDSDQSIREPMIISRPKAAPSSPPNRISENRITTTPMATKQPARGFTRQNPPIDQNRRWCRLRNLRWLLGPVCIQPG